MSKTFHICDSLKQRLLHFSKENIEDEFKKGVIVGFQTDNDSVVYCTGVSSKSDYLPPGNGIVGIYTFLEDASEADVLKIARSYVGKKKSGKWLVLTLKGEDLSSALYDIKSKSLSEISYESISDDEVYKEAIPVTFSGITSFEFSFSKEKYSLKSNVTEKVKRLKESCKSWKIKMVQSEFQIENIQDEKYLSSLTLADLYDFYELNTEDLEGLSISANMKSKMLDKIRKNKAAERTEIIFELLNDDKNDNQANVQTITCKTESEIISLPINVSFSFLAQPLTNLVTLCRYFTVAGQLVFDKIGDCIVQNADIDSKTIIVPQVFNFNLKDICAHNILVVYPQVIEDSYLVELRRTLHLQHLIPLDRPYLRKANFNALTQSKVDGRLLNVHVGLSPSGLTNSTEAIVFGKYCYHHYNQDRFDDNGWGCAYRSLQTLVSWFRLQGYTEKTIPTHREIQEILVEIGDKEKSFIGSSQWIGSQEVSYVLNQLYGITSKIMFVSAGSELANKGRELIHHFTTQGTPIMTGGASYAYTIIGVDFSETSGDIRFLVLDPHYTGAEDLSIIQKKGWCGWKPPTFWNKTAFYNLCMPQKPIEF